MIDGLKVDFFKYKPAQVYTFDAKFYINVNNTWEEAKRLSYAVTKVSKPKLRINSISDGVSSLGGYYRNVQINDVGSMELSATFEETDDFLVARTLGDKFYSHYSKSSTTYGLNVKEPEKNDIKIVITQHNVYKIASSESGTNSITNTYVGIITGYEPAAFNRSGNVDRVEVNVNFIVYDEEQLKTYKDSLDKNATSILATFHNKKNDRVAAIEASNKAAEEANKRLDELKVNQEKAADNAPNTKELGNGNLRDVQLALIKNGEIGSTATHGCARLVNDTLSYAYGRGKMVDGKLVREGLGDGKNLVDNMKKDSILKDKFEYHTITIEAGEASNAEIERRVNEITGGKNHVVSLEFNGKGPTKNAEEYGHTTITTYDEKGKKLTTSDFKQNSYTGYGDAGLKNSGKITISIAVQKPNLGA